MGCAIALVAANASADPVCALWRHLAAFEGLQDMADIGLPPHLTLAIYDEAEPAAMADAFDRIFRAAGPLSVTFDRIAIFEGDPQVVWAAPAASDALRALHARLHEVIDPTACKPYYRPDRWLPHLTLANHVPEGQLGEAAAAARAGFVPFTVTFDRADLVSFPEIEVWRLHRLVLRG